MSIVWAVDPSAAWEEANRTLAYLAAFGAGLALVRLAPERWTSLLAAVVLAAVAVSVFALLTKVLPGSLNPDEIVRPPARAVRLLERRRRARRRSACPAACGSGRGATATPRRALAFPALGLLLLTVLLSYSRGSLLALAAGCGLWFATRAAAPARRRGAGRERAGRRPRGAWAFSQRA